jgi:hypothetical protein
MLTKDKEALSDALDRRLRNDPQLRRLSRTILRTSHVLRSKVSKAAWQTYLRIDELTNERHGVLVEIAIRLALKRGRKQGRKYVLAHIDGTRRGGLVHSGQGKSENA